MAEYVGEERRKEHRVPCIQDDSIKQLFVFHNEKMKSMSDMRITQVEIGKDVIFIKEQIQNGLSHTVNDMHKSLTDLLPIIQEQVKFKERLEDWFWSTVKGMSWVVGIIIIALIVWAIHKGFNPPLSA